MPDAPEPIVDAVTPVISNQPQEQTVSSGENYTLTVTASVTDGGALSYQWYQATDAESEGTPIKDATLATYESSYTLQDNETEKVFYYYVVITNTNNSVNGNTLAQVTSDRAKVTVNNKTNAALPVITEQPTGYNDTKPESYTLTVKATVSDEGKLSYQWYKNDVAIEGATSSSYVIPEADLVVGTNEYYVVVTNTNESVDGEKVAKVTSDKVTVTIIENAPDPIIDAVTPVISNQPQEQTVSSGENYTLTVTASVTDGGALSYQWYQATDAESEGTPIKDATLATYESSYTLQDNETEKVFYYYVVITNTNNSVNGNTLAQVTSDRAKVTVNNKTNAALPVITEQPTGYNDTKPESYTLTVKATVSDEGKLSYQWYKNDVAIEGATSSSYVIPEADLVVGTNEYYVVVTNTNESVDGEKVAKVTSDKVTVTIIEIVNAAFPVITKEPTGYNGIKPESHTLTVEATVSDGGNLSYQWYKNVEAIEGAIFEAYAIPEADLVVGTNEYYVVVTNTNNNVNGEKTASVTSDKATVTIIQTVNAATPVISNQPQNTSIDDGDSFVLSVVASVIDGGSLSYQWYIAEDASSEGKAISGETKATLSTSYNLKNNSVSEDVYYYVVVTNTNNNVNGKKTASVTSDKAKVTVNVINADLPVITGEPTGYNGPKPETPLKLTVSATVSDGGNLSYQWYKNNVVIEGATLATYEIPQTDLKGTNEYYVVVTNTNNAVGGEKTASATSETVTVTIIIDAVTPVVKDLQNLTVLSGETYSLKVDASITDEGSLSYQWYQATDAKSEGTPIEGATSDTYESSYTLQGSETEKVFYYYVVVTNTNDSVNGKTLATESSNHVEVTVNNKINAVRPVINAEPASFEGRVPTSYTLFVSATVSDGGNLSYQWYKNGEEIEGATSSSYQISQDNLTGTNDYYVVVTNTNNGVDGVKTASVTSATATVTIIVDATAPVIEAQPQSKSADDGKAFELSINAKSTDNGTLTYQWYMAADASSEGKAISGATTATLSTIYDLKDYNVAEDMYYYVVVTNTNNSVNGNTSTSVTSSRAKVTVNEVEKDHDINIDFN